MKRNDPVDVPVFCVASGKGGVGKTSISLSIANELAASAKVLVVDLDYFNRGVSGMLIDDSELVAEGDPFLVQKDIDSSVLLVKIASKPQIIVAPCGEMDVGQMRELELEPAESVQTRLAGLLQNLVDEFKIDVVILDAHGGPDNLSFCAVTLATEIILVSDPDKVTLHGTFNFLARLEDYLEQIGFKEWPNIHLLFNRVSSSFNYRGLDLLYRESLDDWMNKPLLGVMPFQPDIFESFANAPFITDLFPNSLFAQKIRLIAYKLLSGKFDNLLSDKIMKVSRLPKLESQITQFQLFKPSKLAIAVGASFVLLFFTTLRQAVIGDDSIENTLSRVSFTTVLGYLGLGLSSWIAIGIWFKGVRASLRFSRNTFYGRLYRWKLWLNLSALSIPAIIVASLLASAFTSVRESSQERAIVNNLRQISSASQQYFLEEGVITVKYEELEGIYFSDIMPITGEGYKDLFLHGFREHLATITSRGTVVSYGDGYHQKAFSGRLGILFNLMVLRAARDTYFHAIQVDSVEYSELAGSPGTNKLIRELTSIAGEDYSSVVLRKGIPLSVMTGDGELIELNSESEKLVVNAPW